MNVKYAAILAGGAGTKMSPAGFAVPKPLKSFDEFWPGGSREVPVVGLISEDLAQAGIENLYIITTGRHRQMYEDYFNAVHPEHAEQLNNLGKSAAIGAERMRRLRLGLNQVEMLVQPPDKYGTQAAVEILEAHFRQKDLLSEDLGTLIVSGDDFIYHPDRTSEHDLAVRHWNKAGTDHLIMGKRVNREDAIGKNYGVLHVGPDGNLIGIIEKPQDSSQIPGDDPTVLVNVSQYFVGPKIWPLVADGNVPLHQGETYFTDTFTKAIEQGQTAVVHEISGYYADCGTPENNLDNQIYLGVHKRTSPPRHL